MIIKYLGHSGFWIKSDNTHFIVDPFVKGMPYENKIDIDHLPCEYLLLTHAHQDHVQDAPAILQKTASTLVANYEIATYFQKKYNVTKTVGMNIGGKLYFEGGFVKMVTAIHSSSFADGSNGGIAGGFLFEIAEIGLYVAGDTALHNDMKLIPEFTTKPIVSILPIGGLFTMDIDDALKAALMTNSSRVIGCHYDTFPPISIDHQKAISLFKTAGIDLILMSPGENIEI